jgi:hypothetical protein
MILFFEVMLYLFITIIFFFAPSDRIALTSLDKVAFSFIQLHKWPSSIGRSSSEPKR